MILQEKVIYVKRHFRIIVCIFALYLCLAAITGTACAEMIELSCGKVEYLNYQCMLPDGRLRQTHDDRRFQPLRQYGFAMVQTAEFMQRHGK